VTNDSDIIYSSAIFGECSPYLGIIDGRAVVSSSIKDLIDVTGSGRRSLDMAAVLSLLNYNYIQGDRTLVEEVSRIPWHSDVTASGNIVRKAPLAHGNARATPQEIANKMRVCLQRYIESVVLANHSTIWLTLSGGYDSRVIAGILNEISTERQNIRVLTWGIESSRDVVYAKIIAQHFGWEVIYLPYYDEYLANILRYAIEEDGAETSALDYNAMETNKSILESITDNDAIIFAHYGDGVGRALYGGVHVSNLKRKPIRNNFGLFNFHKYRKAKAQVEKSRASAWSTDASPRAVKAIAQNELDQHENYMRRMLTKNFRYCHKYDPFTDPSLVKYVYSIDARDRTSLPYKDLLRSLDHFLYELPYANTGVSFSGEQKSENDLIVNTHSKPKQFQEFYAEVSNVLLNGSLVRHNVLSQSSLTLLLRYWKTDESLSSLVSRLYGVELFVRKFGIDVPDLHETVFSRLVLLLLSNIHHINRRAKSTIRKPRR